MKTGTAEAVIPVALLLTSISMASTLVASRNVQGVSERLPRQVFYPGLAYHSTLHRTVLFGGLGDDRSYPGTWEWNGLNWRRRDGAQPPVRAGHGMVFDSARDRVVVFAGFAPKDQLLGDTWEFDGAAWHKMAETGPAPRGAFGMAYDSRRRRTIVFGGSSGPGRPVFNDTWEWDGQSWSQIATTGPTGRSFHKMVYDREHDVVVSFGGRGGGDDTWTWDGRLWTKVADAGPPPRDHHAMAYDSRRARVMMFGGSLNLPDGGYPPQPTLLRDLWEWDGRTWREVSAEGPPSGGGLPGLTFDEARNKLVLFGGGGLEGTWEWNGTGWARVD